MTSSISVLLLVIASACACNSASSEAPSTRVATPAELESMCDASCARSARCNTPTPTAQDAGGSCTEACVSKLGNLAKAVRGDVVRGLQRCYEGLACGVNDDGCTGEALAATGESVDAAVHAADVRACLAKNDECKGTADPFMDDDCGLLPLLVQSEREALARCFDGSCSAVAACLTPLFGS